jgi:hypothetical protein
MPDELDPQLLRAFAAAQMPLAEQPFLSQVSAQVRPVGVLRLSAVGIYSLVGTLLNGLATGILVPLRLRHARLMTLGAAAVTVCAAFL